MASSYIPQVDYTSRDYSSIRDDMIRNIPNFAPEWTSRDQNDFGIIMLEMFAYMGDLMSFYIDKMANEAYIGTATQRDSVLSIASLLGYNVTQGTPATATLTFAAVDSPSSIVVPAGTLVATSTVVDASGAQIEFETDSEITVPAGSAGVTVSATQGRTVSSEVLTSSFNGLPNQAFQLSESPVDIYSIVISVNGTVYQRVNNLIDYSGNSPVFTTSTDTNDNVYVVFGDNLGGRIPPLSASITATYRVIDGSRGNVPAGSINYILTNYSPGLTVTNTDESVGGTDIESTSSIRVNAPRSLRGLNRAVTLTDYSNFALQTVGVGKASSIGNSYNSIVLYVASTGGSDVVSGTPTAAWESLADEVELNLVDKTPPGTTVTILPPTYLTINIDVTVYIQAPYRQDTIQSQVNSAMLQLLSYSSVTFGQSITIKDVIMAGALVQGVSNVVVNVLSTSSSGIADIVCAEDEIPVAGTINITLVGGVI